MSTGKPVLPAGLLPEQFYKELRLSPSFRGKQVVKALQQGARSWSEISTLPAAARERLEKEAPLFSTQPEQVNESPDGSVKMLIRLSDGRAVEAVLLTDERERKTACLSSQVGCAMGCTFCKTGTMGLIRNLRTGEILEQYYHLKNHSGDISNIVFMGMGEPLANTAEVSRAVELLNHPEGPNISIRKITVSTCGLVAGIRELAESPLLPKLACSLISADPELRSTLMPITRTNPLPELKAALRFYYRRSGRRITLECVLLGGVNCDEKEAKKVAAFADGLSVLVNVIPWNPVPELDYRTPTEKEISDYTAALERAGVTVSRRYRRGTDINGACGQLAVLENGPDSPDPGR
jgi:23S rRNA (adenine2503-C2)-methyltransferase